MVGRGSSRTWWTASRWSSRSSLLGLVGPGGCAGVVGVVAAVGETELPTAFDVFALPLGGLVALTGVTGGELDDLLRGDAGLQLAATFELGVELRAEEEGQVGDPQPQQEDDDAGQRPVGL